MAAAAPFSATAIFFTAENSEIHRKIQKSTASTEGIQFVFYQIQLNF
jgi:hypothetical protein